MHIHPQSQCADSSFCWVWSHCCKHLRLCCHTYVCELTQGRTLRMQLGAVVSSPLWPPFWSLRCRSGPASLQCSNSWSMTWSVHILERQPLWVRTKCAQSIESLCTYGSNNNSCKVLPCMRQVHSVVTYTSAHCRGHSSTTTDSYNSYHAHRVLVSICLPPCCSTASMWIGQC